MTTYLIRTIGLLALTGVMATSATGRDSGENRMTHAPSVVQVPQRCVTEHNIGDIALGLDNFGTIGPSFWTGTFDFFTGQPVRSCQYPIGSNQSYLWGGAVWIGGIVGTDTLVSAGIDGWNAGEELYPDAEPLGAIKYRSTLSSNPAYRNGAVSHQDFLATFYDTCRFCGSPIILDALDRRPHKPLNLRIDQHTYAWRYPWIEDGVIWDLTITNIGTTAISKACIGLYVDGDVKIAGDPNGYLDDITGFIDATDIPGVPCSIQKSLPLAWIADDDGDLTSWGRQLPHVTGVALLSDPAILGGLSYNWWTSASAVQCDFGPMRRSNARDFTTGGTGTPVGDRNKYYLLTNGDIDYDEAFGGTIGDNDPIWLPRPGGLLPCDEGGDVRYLLSVGPFDLAPGQSVPLTFAYVGGKDLHIDPSNLQNLPLDPWRYYQHMNFANLKNNAVWASWVYDNPGVDTDSDGYAGQFSVCNSDTIWTAGDGVPDFRAAFPPPRPGFTVTPLSEGFLVRWNGLASETTPDPFSHRLDFEGYNIYLRRLGETTWQKIANYDVESYFKMAWDFDVSDWRPQPYAMTLADLRCRYAPGGCKDSSWSPKNYSRSTPFVLPGASDSIFYFVPVGCNASRFGFETAIEKIYPAASKPRWSRPQDVPADSADFYLTADARFKYYEYQFVGHGLLTGETYQVNLTATDYGPAFSDASYPLESSLSSRFLTVTTLPTQCCIDRTGNVDCDPGNQVDIADLTVLIDNLFISFTPLCCPAAANIDVDAQGGVDISDLSRLIDYLFISFTPPEACR